MSARPSTPNTPTARRTAGSSSSLNPRLPRQPSNPLLANNRTSGTIRTSTSPVKQPSNGRLSPTKRSTAASSSSNNTLKTALSSASLASQRSAKATKPRPARHSSDDPETSDFPDEDSGEEEEADREVPTRKAGFGLPPPPKSPRKVQDSTRSLVQLGENGEEDEEATDGKAVNVVVCLRVRPTRYAPAQPIYKFLDDTTPPCLSFAPTHPVIVKRGAMTAKSATSDEYDFTFDALHLPPKPTEVLYDAKIRPVVRAAMRGFNGTVFAYGQTASGKTHTMMGAPDEPGVIPLAVDELFSYIHDQGTTRDFSLRVSFLEIYNESIRDLLVAPSTSRTGAAPKSLDVVGDDGHIKGLSELPVSMPSEVLALLAEGDQRRRTGATDWNERSSRSHSVFVVTIESLSKGHDCTARTSRLSLIDLAGSEAATGQEERRQEGKFINKSLLTLSTVIGKLSEPRTSSALIHIPYRDSKLTRYLQPALSGKSRVAVICTISPDEQQATETLSTLKFARRAGRVITKAERGVLVTDAMLLRQYEAQVALLQAQIAQREGEGEEGVDGDELTRQLGEAAAKADEAERRGKEAEAALALKEAELASLRSQLEHAKSFILTGPSLEANARRASLGFGGGEGAEPMSLLSPTRGKRIASDVSGLGLGTPRSGAFRDRLMRVASSSRADWSSPKVGTLEKEADLERQLEAAIAKLTALQSLETEVAALRSQVTELQQATALAQGDAEKSAQTNSNRKQRVRALEEELAAAKERGERVAVVEGELEEARSKLEEMEEASAKLSEGEKQQLALVEELGAKMAALEEERATLVQTQQDNSTSLQAQLAELRQALSSAQEETRSKADELAAKEDERQQLERHAQQAQRDLAAKEALLAADSSTRDATIVSLQQEIARLKKERDELVASLERSLASTKEELAAVLATRDTMIRKVEDEAAAAFVERDLALKGQMEAQARIGEVEELSRLEQERHDVAQQLMEREKGAALSALEAEIKKLEADAEAKDARLAHLQRLADAQAKQEQDQANYVSNQRAGTDALQARLETLRGRQTPTNLSSSTSLRSSRSSSVRLSAGQDLESVSELQERNGELVMRVQDLEKQLAEALAGRSGTPAVKGYGAGLRRVGSVDTAKVGLGLKEKLEMEEQKRKLEETQAVAEDYRRKLLAAQRLLDKLAAGSSTAEKHNDTSHASRPSLSELNLPIESTQRRPPPISRHGSSATTPIPASPTPGTPTRPTHTPQGSYSKNLPPPLPYSPHNTEKVRKTRRITTAHDIERLKEVKAVDKARELFDSPGGGSSGGARLEREGSTRRKKESWE